MTLSDPVVYYPSVSSTQTEAKRTLLGVHWTSDQTAGKGRFDRTWYSESGQSLAVSVCLPSYVGFEKPYLIGMWIGLAIAQEFDLHVQWPNDLVLNRRKVCGLLTEVIEGVPVVGFGLNVGPMAFPLEIAERASSLANEGAEVGSVEMAFERVLRRLEALSEVPLTWEEMASTWSERDETRGKVFKLHDGRMGTAEGISEAGELVWRGSDGVELVSCADALWGVNYH